jgi:beta-glucosidase
MKPGVKIIVSLLLFSSQITAQTPSLSSKMDAYINNLMSKMTVDEKIGQLNLASGSGGIAVARTGIDSMYKQGMVGAAGGYTLQSIRNTQQKAVEGSMKDWEKIHGSLQRWPGQW